MLTTQPTQAVSLALVLLTCLGCASTDETNAREPLHIRDTAEPAEPVEPASPAEDPVFRELRQRERAVRQRRGVLVDHQLTLGRRFMETGRLEAALKAYAAALELDPKRQDARRRYAVVAGLLGRNPQAMLGAETRGTWETLHARLQQLTYLARAHFRRGHHFKTQGMYDDALREYRSAQLILEVNPQIDADYDTLRIKAAIARCERDKQHAGRVAEARKIEEVDALLRAEDKQDRQRIASRVLRMWREANALFERGDFDGCERLCEKIMDLDPRGEVLRRR